MSAPKGKILAISGGVGGAKLALGLAREFPADQLLICANTGDDFSHLGLRICPDLDTVMYTLAGISNQQLGWGLEDESWQFMAQLSAYDAEDWFRLGDRDLATHVLRSHWLAGGMSLSEATQQLCRRLAVKPALVPMTDQTVATRVQTCEGELSFQHYFVARRCQPQVRAIEFRGIDQAQLQPAVRAWLSDPELCAVVICPSNPFVSVAPVLAVPGMRAALRRAEAPVIAVSPIVGGQAIKGPAAKMMRELDLPASALAVARHYGEAVDGFVIDELDRDQASLIEALGMHVLVTNTVMHTQRDKEQLAREVVSFASDLRSA